MIWLGFPPQIAFCQAWLLSEGRISREVSSYAPPNLTFSLSSPHVRLARPPMVSVSRFSSCMFTRPPAHPKLAGLSRSTLVVITSGILPSLVYCTVTPELAGVITRNDGDSRWKVLFV